MGVVMPNLRASAMTVCGPSSMPTLIAARLRDWYSARRMGIGPWNLPSKLDGVHDEPSPCGMATGSSDDDRGGHAAVLHGGRVDDRLERRAGLAERLRRAVELGVVVVAAADERAHRAGTWIHRDERALQVRRVRGGARRLLLLPARRRTARTSDACTRRSVRPRWRGAAPRARARRPTACRRRAWCRPSGRPRRAGGRTSPRAAGAPTRCNRARSRRSRCDSRAAAGRPARATPRRRESSLPGAAAR